MGSSHFCISCREKNKGDDVCVTSKEEDCFVCLQFTSELRKKLKAKKSYVKKKSSKESISKEVEDSLLGTYDIQLSSVTATPNEKSASSLPSTMSTSFSVSNSSTVPLQLILVCLEAQQGRLPVLETKSAETSSSRVFAMTEEDDGVLNEDGEQRTHHK